MKNKTNTSETVELFSSPKKVFKTLDKTLAKQGYEFLIKAEEEGKYGIFTPDSSRSIATEDDVFKTCMGLLYFEYGVGKPNDVPSWLMSGTGAVGARLKEQKVVGGQENQL